MHLARAFIGLGSNLGDRIENLRAAVQGLGQLRLKLVRVSSVYESEPIGPVLGQPAFLNAAAEVRTGLGPRALLAELLQLEAKLGRERGVPKGPRLIDLDLLLYNGRVAVWPELVLPHPEIGRRAFVALPLLELDPGLVDPRTGQPLANQLQAVGEQAVRRLTEGSIA